MHFTLSVCKLFIRPRCAWTCLSLWLFVLQRLNSVTSLSGRSVYHSQYPMVLAIVSAASGCSPFAHWLYWGGYRAGIALILKETPFFPSFISFLSQSSFFFVPPALHRFREVNKVTPLLSILSAFNLSKGCVYQVSRLNQIGSVLATLWIRRRSDVWRR